MLKGLALTLSACFIWGLIFAIPIFLNDFSPLEIALGRYFFFGIISMIFFIGGCYQNLIKYSLQIWLKALWLALIANIIYYTSIVLAIQYSNAGIATLIAGAAPVTIAFYGNWREKECSFNKLVMPGILIIIGLFIVNIDEIINNQSMLYSYKYFFGLICAFLALICWSWYIVTNAQFLKAYPFITHFEWSTMLGVATFIWVSVVFLVLNLGVVNSIHIQKYFLFTPEVKLFLGLTAILGCLCSWLGSYLWNSGCTLLPLSLSGQMTIFETVFGLFFVYIIEQKLPSILECLGIIFMLLAIAYSVNMFAKINQKPIHT